MSMNTFLIFLAVFFVLIVVYFVFRWLSKKRDASKMDLTTAIEDFTLPAEQTMNREPQKTWGELELLIRDKEVSVTKIGDQEIVIGRDPTQSTLIIAEPTVSKVHCGIQVREGKIFIKDNHSTNGTFVNDIKTAERELRSGDIISLGKKGTVKLIFRATPD